MLSKVPRLPLYSQSQERKEGMNSVWYVGLSIAGSGGGSSSGYLPGRF